MISLSTLFGIEAVLFDLDGTLVLTEDRTDRAVTALLNAHGVSGEPEFDPSRFHGVTWEAIGVQLAERWPVLGTIDVAAKLHRLFHETFLADPPTPVPGAPEAVAAAAAVMPTAIVTSSNRETLALVCDQLDLHGLITTTITAEDCTQSKPFPEPFFLAADRLGVAPERCLVFEDSVAGIQAGAAVGATVIAIGAESGHEPWIPDFYDLPEDFFMNATRTTHA
jgi:sugar-phosphatase